MNFNYIPVCKSVQTQTTRSLQFIKNVVQQVFLIVYLWMAGTSAGRDKWHSGITIHTTNENLVLWWLKHVAWTDFNLRAINDFNHFLYHLENNITFQGFKFDDISTDFKCKSQHVLDINCISWTLPYRKPSDTTPLIMLPLSIYMVTSLIIQTPI